MTERLPTLLVQFYTSENRASAFDASKPFDGLQLTVTPPPGRKLNKRMVTQIMDAFRYRPVGKWQACDWGFQRNYDCRR